MKVSYPLAIHAVAINRSSLACCLFLVSTAPPAGRAPYWPVSVLLSEWRMVLRSSRTAWRPSHVTLPSAVLRSYMKAILSSARLASFRLVCVGCLLLLCIWEGPGGSLTPYHRICSSLGPLEKVAPPGAFPGSCVTSQPIWARDKPTDSCYGPPGSLVTQHGRTPARLPADRGPHLPALLSPLRPTKWGRGGGYPYSHQNLK